MSVIARAIPGRRDAPLVLHGCYSNRTAFTYNDRCGNKILLNTVAGETAITIYQHNGQDTVTTCVNGTLSGTDSGNNYVVRAAFGSGGSLAIPYWSGNKPATGDVAEILAFDCELDDAERAAVDRYLGRRYRPSSTPAWRIATISSAPADNSRSGKSPPVKPRPQPPSHEP